MIIFQAIYKNEFISMAFNFRPTAVWQLISKNSKVPMVNSSKGITKPNWQQILLNGIFPQSSNDIFFDTFLRTILT